MIYILVNGEACCESALTLIETPKGNAVVCGHKSPFRAWYHACAVQDAHPSASVRLVGQAEHNVALPEYTERYDDSDDWREKERSMREFAGRDQRET